MHPPEPGILCTQPASNATAGWWRTDMMSFPSVAPSGPGGTEVVGVGDVADDGEGGYGGYGRRGLRRPGEDPHQKEETELLGLSSGGVWAWLRFAREAAER